MNIKRFDVEVISFGVDIELFKPNKIIKKKFNVGTIKSIERAQWNRLFN